MKDFVVTIRARIRAEDERDAKAKIDMLMATAAIPIRNLDVLGVQSDNSST